MMNCRNRKNHPPLLTRNPNSIKIRFALKFLQSINKLKSFPLSNRHTRYHFIRTASYTSMASAVGPSRAWSRALLQNRRHHNHQFLNSSGRWRRRRIIIRRRRNPSREDDLRGLIPGGESMDSCRLLSESAHYIKCLRAQVQVMTKMLHYYSPSK